MLRIVLGYRSAARAVNPAVLYCGHSGAEAQSAIDKAKGFHGLETAEIPMTRRAKRSQSVLVEAAAETRRRADKKREKLAESRSAQLTPLLSEGSTLPENLADLTDAEFEVTLEQVKALFQESEAEAHRREKLQTARHKALSVYVRNVPADLFLLTEEEFADALAAAVEKDIASRALFAARSADLGAVLPPGSSIPEDLADLSETKFAKLLADAKKKRAAASKPQSQQLEQ